MEMNVKHRKLTTVLRYLYVLFLVGTGAMTLFAWSSGVDFTEGTSAKTAHFMQGIMDSGYIIPWMGIFKIVAGIILAIPRTAALGAMMALPYAVNILLYVLIISSADYLGMGIFDVALSFYLVYAYSDYYKPMVSVSK